jgi:hypothetical protein
MATMNFLSFGCPRKKPNGNLRARQNVSESGQIIVEYVLLLAVAVSLAILIVSTLIGRDPGNEGFVIKSWQILIEQIGTDQADDINKKN